MVVRTMNKILIIILILLLSQIKVFAQEFVNDDFAQNWYKDKQVKYFEPVQHYDYSSLKREKIILTPTEKYSTPHLVYDGMPISLEVKRNARIGRSLLRKGTPAKGIVELYTTNGMTGIQATITVGQIEIQGLDSRKLGYYYIKEGQNRSTWILPLKWALTFIPFVGSFTNLIKGGQAVLKPGDEIPVFYYYDWI